MTEQTATAFACSSALYRMCCCVCDLLWLHPKSTARKVERKHLASCNSIRHCGMPHEDAG
eukprot:3173977-Pyramimonas_sp.AAC.1